MIFFFNRQKLHRQYMFLLHRFLAKLIEYDKLSKEYFKLTYKKEIYYE